MSHWQRVATLDEVRWPDDAILLVDVAVQRFAPAALRDRMIVVKAGESLKRLATIERLAEQVLSLASSRPLTLVAMGGGSVGDAVGFLASILWRGVTLWHVPTTLLAAVDSAHGGKTAVNLGHAKNQLGTFYPAERVIVADAILRELPTTQRAAGLTELVKALWLGDAQAVDLLDAGVAQLAFAPYDEVAATLSEALDRAVRVKHDIVERDPFERKGIRTWLNLGHTAGHALELVLGLSHGVAVAWGIAAAAHLSHTRDLLPAAPRDRLLRHVYPLLGTRAPNLARPLEEKFLAALRRDKKSVDGKVRSVLLAGVAQPVVVDDVSPQQWLDAVQHVRATLFDAPVHLHVEAPRSRQTTIALAASKSELNRALAIAALRGEPPVTAVSSADDVAQMRAGIEALRRGEVAYAGDGGTTFRFLAVVAVGVGGGEIEIGEQLARRPHDALFEALRRGGVSVTQSPGTRRFRFGALPDHPVTFEVDASSSSQFASALTMLSAVRDDVDVRIIGPVASSGYLEMTRAMLRQHPLRVTPDASSAVLWHLLARLGFDVVLAEAPGALQPDAVAPSLLWEVDRADDLSIDVGGAPDLVPVFAAYAALSTCAVELVGAPHLRHKESNRIDDLVAAFGEVGVQIEARADGVAIPRGRQSVAPGALFDPRGDHRLAFAAAVLATSAPLLLKTPRCANKSYPAVYDDLVRCGFLVTPKW